MISLPAPGVVAGERERDLALAMCQRTSFGGINDFGTGSAIAVFLFLLVVPVHWP